MKNHLFVVGVLVVISIAAGCNQLHLRGNRSDGSQRTFLNRTVIYTLDSESRGSMQRLEQLLCLVRGIDPSSQLPDEIGIALYRDADVNGDHHISGREAKALLKNSVSDYENSLPPISFRKKE